MKVIVDFEIHTSIGQVIAPTLQLRHPAMLRQWFTARLHRVRTQAQCT